MDQLLAAKLLPKGLLKQPPVRFDVLRERVVESFSIAGQTSAGKVRNPNVIARADFAFLDDLFSDLFEEVFDILPGVASEDYCQAGSLKTLSEASRSLETSASLEALSKTATPRNKSS